jgi:hypothetical protein
MTQKLTCGLLALFYTVNSHFIFYLIFFLRKFYLKKTEVIFGYAPFVSNSLDELERKILDDSVIQVKNQ